MIHGLLDITDGADAPVLIPFDQVPVLTYLVLILHAFPEEVSCLLGKVFVFGGKPYSFFRG